jgi:pimeloyl-ACP methyl ester carboxylesterase
MQKRFWPLSDVMSSVDTSSYKSIYQNWHIAQEVHLKNGSKLISTASGSVEYGKSGSGPAVLISHGSPGGYDMGLAFADLLESPQFTYLVPSRPGYLRTPLEAGRSPAEQADLYAALLDALSIKQATIIGISGGGPSALQFALRHPERCTSLVIVSGIAQYYSEQQCWQDLSPFQRLIKQTTTKLSSSNPLLYTMLLLTKLLSKNVALAALVRPATLYAQRQRGYNNDKAQFIKITGYPLHSIAVPTFIVHAIDDDEVSFANAELLASQVPQAKLLAIPDAKHMAFYTHANIVMPALKEFLIQAAQKQEPTNKKNANILN